MTFQYLGNPYENQKTVSDYMRQNTADQAARQQLDTNKLQQASEKLNLITNIAYGVKDDATYQQAKQTLSGLGLDPRQLGMPDNYDPAWVNNTQQSLTAQKAQMNAMYQRLMLGLKAEGNTTQAAGVMGNVNAAGDVAPLSSSLSSMINGKVNPDLGRLINQESGGNPNAVSPKGAGGITQIMPATAAQPGFGVAPLQGMTNGRPETAPLSEQLRFGNDYKNAMDARYGDNRLGAAAYNAGAGRVDAALKNLPAETQNYVKNVAFIPPQREQGETQAAYKQRVDTAFDAYKENPDVIAAQEGAKTTANKTATENVDRSANYTKAQSALVGFTQQAKLVTDTIDKALEVANKPYSAATGYGQIGAYLPNTDARELNNYLATIKSNIGFDKLQNMRDNSPTGGALGQVSDTENRLLQATQGALDPLQSKQLVENLKTIKELYPIVLAEKQRAFEQDYGSYTPLGNNPQPIKLNDKIAPKANGDFSHLWGGAQ